MPAKHFLRSAFLLLSLSILYFSCKKEKKLTESLYVETTDPALNYYLNKDSILSAAGTSPHGSFKLRFNQLAVSQFGSDGKFPAGGTFADGSLIVKEVYKGGVLSLYAVMKKDDSKKYSANGWLWAEYGTDGSVIYGLSEKGKSCTGCHSGTGNRDLTLSFGLH